MSKEQTLEIVRRWRASDGLWQQCRDAMHENRISDVLQLLLREGVHAREEDLVEALNVYWVMDRLGPNGKSEGVEVVAERHSLLQRTVVKRKTADKGTPSGSSSSSENAVEGFDMGLELQKGLVNVLRQIDRGYDRVMMMYTMAFWLGFGLVVVSVAASLLRGADASTYILGGLGVADVVASLVFRPAQDVQNSRGNLAQLQSAFFSWINDVYNWNRYLRLLDEQATANGSAPDYAKVREVSDTLVQNTEKMAQMVERYCETYASPRVRKPRAQPDGVANPSKPDPAGATV